MVKKFGLAFAAVPVLGWLLSLPWNWHCFGTPFTASGEWNNFPLLILTIPCLQIWDFLDSIYVLRHYHYPVVLLYTLICTGLYFLVGATLGLCVRQIAAALKRRT